MTSVWDFVLDFRPVSHPCVFSISDQTTLIVHVASRAYLRMHMRAGKNEGENEGLVSCN